MALSAATRRPVSARTSVSRQRTTVVKCSAQQPSAARQLLAAGAALAVVLGSSVSPAEAFPFEQQLKGFINNPGKTNLPPQGAPETKTVIRDEQKYLPPGNAAKSGTGSDLVQVKAGAPAPADATKNAFQQAGK